MSIFKFQNATSLVDIKLCNDIRERVFCEEQKIPKDIEFDNLDHICKHFLVFKNKKAIATARVRQKQDSIYKIERVAVLISFRREKVGTLLIEELINLYQRMEKNNSIILHSQDSVTKFYKKLNFIPYGQHFKEDGILHIAMKYST